VPDKLPRIIEVLRRYAGDPRRPVTPATALEALGIDDLDLAMLCLDIEDAFDVSLALGGTFNGILTVADLGAVVDASLLAKARSHQRPRRRRGGWMSTAAAQR
jgi:acyl carrier protein